MSLVTPEFGLIFWQAVVFLILLFVLRKFVWKPILGALKMREFQIEDALRAAEAAKDEMEQIKMDNDYLLYEARIERDQMLKDATTVANKIKDDAKAETSKISEKMITEAKSAIETEKKSAMVEIKETVSSLSLEIAEKILRENLKEDKAQKDLVVRFLKDTKIN
ncbi:MAG: F0F1 ATP synthase subunit B [Cytophagales bacterium]|nr:F0F1 ATP synthase subunit B [Cytophagales bacterium]